MSAELTIEHNYNLQRLNTFGIAAHAAAYVSITSQAELQAALQDPALSAMPRLILGGGSNIVLTNDFPGVVLHMATRGMRLAQADFETILVTAAAGENWHDLVMYTVAQGWYGLENLALIPGLTGAAPVQNIGAYGVQLEDCLEYVRAYHLPTQTWHHLTAADCQFGYRDSLFKRAPNTWLITRVGFRLHTNANKILASYGDVQTVAQRYAEQQGRVQPVPADVMQAIIDIRQQKLPDPKQLPNCGSFFQNPIIPQTQFITLQSAHPTIVGYPMPDAMVKVAAGWLIEQAGLKGHGLAPILTHQQQALVLTNHSPYQATQAVVAKAQQHIADIVHEKFAIELAREPVWVNADGSIGFDEHVV